MNKKILVTGASGFIGSSLVEKLVLEGYEVTALVKYNSSSNIGNLSKIPKEILSNITIVFGDIRDAIQMNRLLKDISIVYNLAALISIPYSYNAVESYINTNLIGCKNLMEACISNNVELFVQTSTSEVYGTAIADKIDENHRMLGQSPYAASKIAADQFVQSYFCSYGLPSIIVRPFNTFGPRQSLRAFIPNMIYQIMKHDEIKVGNVQTTRDYTFIDDTVSGFYEAMKIKNRDATAYNLGTGNEYSGLEVINLISNLLGKKININIEQERLRPHNSEVLRLNSDNTRIKKEIGWQPQISMEQGLSEMIRKFDKENLLNFNQI